MKLALLAVVCLAFAPACERKKKPPRTTAVDKAKPGGDKKAADKPAGDEKAADKPAGDKPAADKPAGDKPAADKPAGDQPAGDKPAGDKPAGDDKAAEAPAADKKLVEHGAYLATVAGCAACHTPMTDKGPDMSKMWAGGMEMQEKFGTWRAPNLTQDKKTGIGDWTDEQIDKAVRQGIRPDGSQMYPIMPYQFYNKLSDQDMKAMTAYLRTIKPIENAVKGSDELKMAKPKVGKPAGTHPTDDPIKRGEYLADLMHCAMCHTPWDKEYNFLADKKWQGGFEIEAPPMFGKGKMYSANITSDKETGIGDLTDEQIMNSYMKGINRKNEPILFMMFSVPFWGKMTPDDAKAVAAFIKQIPPAKNKVPASSFEPSEMLKKMMSGPPPGHGKGGPPPGEEGKKGEGGGDAGKGEKPPEGAEKPAEGGDKKAPAPAKDDKKGK